MTLSLAPRCGLADGNPPQLTAGGVSGAGETAATVYGELTSAGDATPPWAQVRLFWGTTDGGSNTAGWLNVTAPVWRRAGPLTFQLAGLRPGRAYFCRLEATNTAGGAWSEPLSFRTRGILHRWSFNDGTMNDSVGAAHGVPENASVRVAGQRLLIDAAGRMLAAPLGGTVTSRTLVAWVSLLDLSSRGGGSALTIESDANGAAFDGIVYGEIGAGRWWSGSESWWRSADVAAGAETVGEPGEVMMAIVYRNDHSIQMYRNGEPFGQSHVPRGWRYDYNQANPVLTYGPNAAAQIGRRHALNGSLTGYFNEARIYDIPLTGERLRELYALGPDAAGYERPYIVTDSPDPVTNGTSALNGTLVSTGSAPTRVWACWGQTDGGTNLAAWDTAHELAGPEPEGPLRVPLSGLSSGVQYCCRFFASNSFGGAWSPAGAVFASPGPPAIVTLPSPTVGGTRALARGALLWDSAPPTAVLIYWGGTDGGEEAGAWEHVLDAGPQPAGAVESWLEGLRAGVTYYYRFAASNALGLAWAPQGASVTTSVSAPSDVDGLLLWVKADDLPLDDGAAVTNWPDASGHGRHLVAGAAPPVLARHAFGGRPVVRFSGAGETLLMPPGVTGQQTVFLVYSDASTAAGATPLGSTVEADRTGYGGYGNETALFDQASCDDSTLYGELYRNGEPIFCTAPRPGTGYAVYAFVAAAPLVQRITNVGSGAAADTSIAGGIAELAVYDRALTAAELNTVGAGLAYKWRLQWVPVRPVLANSARDFSGVQGQAGWRYGCWNREPANNNVYDPAYDFGPDFTEFNPAQHWVWVEWVSKLANHNSYYTTYGGFSRWAYSHKIARVGGHPSANNPVYSGWTQAEAWPIRRWVCPASGLFRIEGLTAAALGEGAAGNGTRAVIFRNGLQIFEQRVAPGQSWPATYTVGGQTPLRLEAGDVLDFALDPIGDNMRDDGTRFTAIIRRVPPPAGMLLIVK